MFRRQEELVLLRQASQYTMSEFAFLPLYRPKMHLKTFKLVNSC